MGHVPKAPSSQLELDWEGGKRKLSVPGAEDASKGIHGHFHLSGASQLCQSEERAGEQAGCEVFGLVLRPLRNFADHHF